MKTEEIIRYLKDDEKVRCKSLWQQAFPEDGEAFTDYYFRRITADNRVLALETDGQIRGMIHRNPRRIQADETVWDSEYIVGVAVDRAYRRQGIMRKLLERTLKDAAEEKLPFVFLTAADKTIYEPFGFVSICEQPVWVVSGDGLDKILSSSEQAAREPFSRANAREAADFANETLARQYRCFALKDVRRLARLQEELAAEAGETILLRDRADGRLKGVFSYTRDCETEIFDVITSSSGSLTEREFFRISKMKRKEPPSWIMLRPADILRFLELFYAGPKDRFQLSLEIREPGPSQTIWNCLWQFQDGYSQARPGREESPVSITIPALIRWLFGLIPAEELSDGNEAAASPQQKVFMEQIRPFHGFYVSDFV